MYSAKYGGRSGRSKGSQATSKKKKHRKCTLCQEKGHDAEDCPRTKNPSKNSGGAGSGRSHKNSRRAGKADDDTSNDNNGDAAESDEGLLPSGFFSSVDDLLADMTIMRAKEEGGEQTPSPPPVLFDAGCDVGEALDYITTTQSNKKKSSTVTYRNAPYVAVNPYGGCLCRQLLKPGKPWKPNAQRISWIKEADPHVLFVLGLGPAFLNKNLAHAPAIDDSDDSQDEEESASNDDEEEQDAAVDALVDAMDRDDGVVGFFAKLDYTPDMLQRPGYDREAQLRRFRATCSAAMEGDVPIQCRIAPGPTDGTPEDMTKSDNAENDQIDPYVSVVRDLATVLVEMSPDDSADSLKIHLVCWNGNSTHMLKLLGAFPEQLYVGMNAAVGFAKAARAHECAFDVPLNRLLLETDAPYHIPAPVTIAMGRAAFSHSGLIPFVAAAVAEHKGRAAAVTAVDVARAATENVVQLYGPRIGAQVEEAAAELAEILEATKEEKAQEELEQGEAPQEEGEQVDKEVVETKQEKKKKKKKKGKTAVQGGGDEGANNDAELNFDEGFLASMVAEP